MGEPQREGETKLIYCKTEKIKYLYTNKGTS